MWGLCSGESHNCEKRENYPYTKISMFTDLRITYTLHEMMCSTSNSKFSMVGLMTSWPLSPGSAPPEGDWAWHSPLGLPPPLGDWAWHSPLGLPPPLGTGRGTLPWVCPLPWGTGRGTVLLTHYMIWCAPLQTQSSVWLG